MSTPQLPCYYLVLNHSLNCATIESAKPNKQQTVLVRSEAEPNIAPIHAIGILSDDSKNYHVAVSTAQGDDSFNLDWEELKGSIQQNRMK